MAEEQPFIPYADRDALPENLKAPLDAYEARMGFMPNALRLYMHRPELLACLVQLNNTVMRDESSHLDAGLKRRISAICSFLNKSAYCVAHNTNTLMNEDGGEGEGWSFSAEDVAKLLDPAYAPGTGTPEIGGLTSIQALEIIRGCRGLSLVGTDLVEVSPPYDTNGNTALLAANLLFEMLCVLPGVAYRD